MRFYSLLGVTPPSLGGKVKEGESDLKRLRNEL